MHYSEIPPLSWFKYSYHPVIFVLLWAVVNLFLWNMYVTNKVLIMNYWPRTTPVVQVFSVDDRNILYPTSVWIICELSDIIRHPFFNLHTRSRRFACQKTLWALLFFCCVKWRALMFTTFWISCQLTNVGHGFIFPFILGKIKFASIFCYWILATSALLYSSRGDTMLAAEAKRSFRVTPVPSGRVLVGLAAPQTCRLQQLDTLSPQPQSQQVELDCWMRAERRETESCSSGEPLAEWPQTGLRCPWSAAVPPDCDCPRTPVTGTAEPPPPEKKAGIKHLEE